MILKILEGKVDEAAVVKTRVDNYMARFANNEITVFKNWTVENTYLYVARGRRVASAGFTGRPALEEVERLVKSLESLPEDPLYVSLGGPAPVSHSEALRKQNTYLSRVWRLYVRRPVHQHDQSISCI